MTNFYTKATLKFSLLIVFIFNCNLIFSQKSGQQDIEFNPRTGANNQILLSVLQNDNKLIIYGNFTRYNGVLVNGLARLNADLTLDQTFNSGTSVNNTISSIEILKNGKILIAGSFTSYNGILSNRIARLNSDGSFDNTFQSGLGANNSINCITIQNDDKILIGGKFNLFNGINVYHNVCRLNQDGSIDLTFNQGTFSNDWGTMVNSINLLPNNKILIGGVFLTYNSVSRKNLALLNQDGSIDLSFNIGSGFDNAINSISTSSDNKILVGGGFTSVNNQSYNSIVKLNLDGSIDANFKKFTVFNSINSIKVKKNGKILIGGDFIIGWNNSLEKFARLNSDGSTDSTYINPLFNGTVTSINLLNDKAVISGTFTKFGNYFTNGIVVLDSIENLNTKSSPLQLYEFGPSSFVNTIAKLADGKILIGGSFTSYNGRNVNRIARLNSNGTIDSTFNIGTGFNSTVNKIIIQKNGKILIAGGFSSYNGLAFNSIIRLNYDGSIDESFNIGTGTNGSINSINVQEDGKIIIGGVFTLFNGISSSRLARLNEDGSLDLSFKIGTGINNNTVFEIIVQTDNKILLAGSFTSFNSKTQNCLVRLNSDGTIDNTFNIGTGFNNSVNSIVLQSDGSIIAGGSYTTFNTKSSNRLIRLKKNGEIDSTFLLGAGFNNSVDVIYLQNDGKVVIGGIFTTFNSKSSNRIIRLDNLGKIDTSFYYGTGIDGTIYSIKQHINGKLLLGGVFTKYDGAKSQYLTRIHNQTNVSELSSQINYQSICQGKSYLFNGKSYTNEGLYPDTLKTKSGLDSIVVITQISYKKTPLIEFSLYENIFCSNANPITLNALPEGGKYNGNIGVNNKIFTPNLLSAGKHNITYTYNNGQCENVKSIEVFIDTCLVTNPSWYPGKIDINFISGKGPNNEVYCSAKLNDGKILIGGVFTNYDGKTKNYFARLNKNGTLDTTFLNNEPNEAVNVIVVQKDGKILLGGSFSKIGSVTRNCIVRLNSDGTIDGTFNIGLGVQNTLNSSSIYSIGIQSDGKIIIGGKFNLYNGQTRNKIARLNSNGTLDASFTTSLGLSGSFNHLSSMAIQKDDKIIISGLFDKVNSTTSFNLARLNSDGTVDLSFVVGTGLNNEGRSIAIQSDGKVLIGGYFDTYKGLTQKRFMRLNSDGSVDQSFTNGSGTETRGIRTINILPNNKILIGGYFNFYSGFSINNIALLNQDGTIDSSFSTKTGFDTGKTVNTSLVLDDGRFFLGGNFKMYNNQEHNYVLVVHGSNTNIKYIKINDNKLFQALLTHSPSIDKDNDGKISYAEALVITNLNLTNKNISTIDGLEQFSNLSYLDVSSNVFDSLDVSKFNNLTYLNAKSNSNLIGICVNQNQLDTKVNQWSKDNDAFWGVGACHTITSTEKLNDTQFFFSAYPNPAENQIFVSEGVQGIYSISGSLAQVVNDNSLTINLNLSHGLYYIQYKSGKTEKLIVK